MTTIIIAPLRNPCSAILAAALLAGSSHAAITYGFTSVDDLNYTNVVGAWNFADGIGNGLISTTVQGVGFVGVEFDGTIGNLTVGGLLSGGSSGFTTGVDITSGGTATDQSNLTSIVRSALNGQQGTNSGNDLTFTLTGLASGTYLIQYIWAVSGSANREFTVTAEGTDLGTFFHTDNVNRNFLLAEQIAVTDGTLNLRAVAGPNAASTDERRLISGLIVSQIPEPSAALLGSLGAFLLLRRRR